jgi:hypothetical protein
MVDAMVSACNRTKEWCTKNQGGERQFNQPRPVHGRIGWIQPVLPDYQTTPARSKNHALDKAQLIIWDPNPTPGPDLCPTGSANKAVDSKKSQHHWRSNGGKYVLQIESAPGGS